MSRKKKRKVRVFIRIYCRWCRRFIKNKSNPKPKQVKHTIFITPNQAEANTSVVFNNARFEDEPTDMDEYGSPLYMKATDTKAAEINFDTLEYKEKYYVPEPKAPVKQILNSEYEFFTGTPV